MKEKMSIIEENINFERGIDPKTSMKIGLINKRNFETPEDVINWILRFPFVVSEGFLKKWDSNDIEKNSYLRDYWNQDFYNFKDNLGFTKSDMAKWLKHNITIKGFTLGLKELKNLVDEVCKRIYERRNAGGLDEVLNFKRGMEPTQALNVGKVHLIQQWLNDGGVSVKNFKINKDFSIDLLTSWINQSRPDLFPNGKFPEYIRFRSSKDFDIDDCGIENLEGCPLIVNGYFSCQMNKIYSLIGMPLKVSMSVYIMGNERYFTEEQIKEKCNVGVNIQADNTPEL
jgi:hypothetical protein